MISGVRPSQPGEHPCLHFIGVRNLKVVERGSAYSNRAAESSHPARHCVAAFETVNLKLAQNTDESQLAALAFRPIMRPFARFRLIVQVPEDSQSAMD